MSTTSEASTRPKIIDVLAAFDVAAIVEKYPNPSHDRDDPAEVDSDHVHPVNLSGDAFSEFGELSLDAAPGDFVRWRATALPFDEDYSVLIYRCVDESGATSEFDRLLGLALLPRLKDGSHQEAEFDTEIVKDQVSAMRLAKTGNPFVRLSFEIVKGDDVIGYFRWNLGLVIPIGSARA
ncbi:AidA/PixA family protein [Kitasatospora sp. NPDC087861]|uniref:AidA/PixA family protein n=1 Tax=Kitasatospora sp. NPDC087861 TaxID=3364070 RepID=UPI003818CE08